MRVHSLGRDDHLAPLLKREIESATVIFRDDIPMNVATLSSRVMFSVNGREPDRRIIYHGRMTSRSECSYRSPRRAGSGFPRGRNSRSPTPSGRIQRMLLHEVYYQ